MKLISLWEPWATLMAIGAKRIETRSWQTPYRGWLAIQAAKCWNADCQRWASEDEFVSALEPPPRNRTRRRWYMAGRIEALAPARPYRGSGPPYRVLPKIDGRAVEAEIFADNGGKARYRYWRQVRECWQDVKLQDIRVKSLRMRKAHIANGWQERLETANAIVGVIAAHGRHFFSENSDRRELVEKPFVSRFLVSINHEVFFVDRYSRKHILVRHQEWPGWSDGGTLRAIVQHLAAHIAEGTEINPGYFGISPDWMPNHWGYGEDMVKVRDGVAEILARAEEGKAHV